MPALIREGRLAFRALLRRPLLSASVILTLGLAIGASTAMYSVVYGVLLQPLPYPDAARIVQVWQIGEKGGQSQFSDPNFEDLRDQSRAFAAIAEYSQSARTAVVGQSPVRALVATVSGGFFDVFGVQPLRGRSFAAGELAPGAAPVAIVSADFWKRALAESSDLSAHVVRIDGRAHSVIGVMAPAMGFPQGTEIWVPREQVSRNPSRTGHNWLVIGRIQPGLTVASGQREVSAVGQRLKAALGQATAMSDVGLVPALEQWTGPVARPLVLLLAAVGCLVVIACANLINLLLVHVSGRARELAVRASLGASRGALAFTLGVETAWLVGLAGALGLALGTAGMRAAVAYAPAQLPRAGTIGMHWAVIVFAVGLTIVIGAVLTAATAWRALQSDIADALRQGQRGNTGGTSARRVRDIMVVVQLAVSLVLLVGAGLLGRSLAAVLDRDAGFKTDGQLVINLQSPSGTPEERTRLTHFHNELMTVLAAQPGVRSVGGINRFPLGGAYANGTFIKALGNERLDDPATLGELGRDARRTGSAHFRVASAGYFAAMQIPLVRGRVFEPQDGPDAPHVALISESLAAASWPGEDPLGRRLQFGNMDGDLRLFTIVGIVKDIRELGLETEARPTLYADFRQRARPTGSFTVVVDAAVDPSSLIAPARQAIARLSTEVAPRFETMRSVFERSVSPRRFNLWLVGGFALAALLLAVLGIYGVLAYVVSQRRQEFGVRLALGSSRRSVWQLVVGRAAVLVGVGLAAGTIGAWFVSRAMATMIFGLAPFDLPTFAGAALVIALTALAASQIPAWRATRVDPLSALRGD